MKQIIFYFDGVAEINACKKCEKVVYYTYTKCPDCGETITTFKEKI